MSIFPLFFLAALSNFGHLQDPQFEPGPIEINAFIYSHGPGVWIASDEPALKSCCRGAPAKSDRQILLEIDPEDLPAFAALNDGRPGLITGEIEKSGSFNASPKWVIKKARLENIERNETTKMVAIAFVTILIVFIILVVYIKSFAS